MEYKETDWFSCMTTPTRIGVYKTQHRGTYGDVISGYSRLFHKGGHLVWSYTQPSIFLAGRMQSHSPQQSREWKGVLRDDVPS